MKYGKLTLGQIEAIINKLGGEKGAHQFLEGKLIVKRPEFVPKIWKTITIGTSLKTGSDFMQAFAKNGIDYNDSVISDALEKPLVCATVQTDVDLVLASGKEMGFEKDVSLKRIFMQAKEVYGLALCSFEITLQLRLQYADQPAGEYLHIGMKPLFHDFYGPALVMLTHSDCFGIKSDDIEGYLNEVPWVFVLPRK